MPPAGEMPAHRAIAHLRWAERYNGLGDVRKATSHTERGLDYIRLSTGFGANQRRAEFSNIKETNADQGRHEAKLDGRSVEITIRKTDDGGPWSKCTTLPVSVRRLRSRLFRYETQSTIRPYVA